jgi:hypothetical protein
MKIPKTDLTIYQMISATSLSQSRIENAINLAKKLTEDPDENIRYLKSLCKACYYFSSISGQALTERECMCCNKLQNYSSTFTDALCSGCAKKYSLCKHCGGDFNLRIKRRSWPSKESD